LGWVGGLGVVGGVSGIMGLLGRVEPPLAWVWRLWLGLA
jgi:hypothetical protein